MFVRMKRAGHTQISSEKLILNEKSCEVRQQCLVTSSQTAKLKFNLE